MNVEEVNPASKPVDNNAVLEESVKAPGKERKMILKDAAKYLGVSHRKIGQMVMDGEIEFKYDPLDRRRKLVSVKDLDRLKQASINES